MMFLGKGGLFTFPVRDFLVSKTVIQAIVANHVFNFGFAYVFAGEAEVIVVKQLRACGGCLGARRR